MGFDDPENKIILLMNRLILDETIQSNWAMSSDKVLYHVWHGKFHPHAHTLDEIKEKSPKADFFWFVGEVCDTRASGLRIGTRYYGAAPAHRNTTRISTQVTLGPGDAKHFFTRSTPRTGWNI